MELITGSLGWEALGKSPRPEQTLVLSEAPLEARLSGGLGGQDSGLETERRASIMVPAEA